MDWNDLRIFLAVARAGTLSGAARVLGQTQPTAGRHIRRLERELGQPLFQRTRDGFVLTAEGSSALAYAERIEEETIAVQRHLAGQDQQLDGALRISASDWFGVHVLTPVLAAFTAAHPRMTIELMTEARHVSLARREADIVFRARQVNEPEVVQRRLMHLRYALYAPKGMAVPRAGDGAGCALVTMDLSMGSLPDLDWLKRQLPNAHVAFRSNNRDVQAQMCAGGAGLAVLPRLIGDRMRTLVPVDLGEEPPGRDVWIGYHRDLRRLARLRALIDATLRHLQGAEPVDTAGGTDEVRS
jgi:DNA-binding transcriptional LysR family regulator